LQSLLPNFGGVRMSALPSCIAPPEGKSPHFLITAFDYDTRRARYFRSNVTSGAASAAAKIDPTLAEAVHASSTAPVRFFDAPAEIGTLRLWDGGVAGLNNPVLAAVVEALAGAIRAADIQILSIGTASVRRPVAPPESPESPLFEPRRDGTSVPNNLETLAGAILDDPPDAASFIVHVTLGQPLPRPHPPSPLAPTPPPTQP